MNARMITIMLAAGILCSGCAQKLEKPNPVPEPKQAVAVQQPVPAAEKTELLPEPAKIQWIHNMADGMKAAQAQNKPVMVDFYADWCGWCKKLDKDVYSQPGVIALSQKFVAVKVNTDKYPDDSKKYGVQGLPTIVFFKPNGDVIQTIVGFQDAAAFSAIMEKAAQQK